jgi:ComF family protein
MIKISKWLSAAVDESDQPIQLKSRLAWTVLTQYAANLLTPPLCLVCDVPVEGAQGLCVACWSKLQHISDPVCDALGTPFEYDHGEGALSAEAIANPPAWDKARAAVAFDADGRKLVHQLKYRDQHNATQAMARMMLQAGRKLVAEADVVMPIPLHPKRLWQRRFNQSALLAHEIGKLAARPVDTLSLQRTKVTRQQVGLDAEERRRNVSRAFAVDPLHLAQVARKTVLLIDDVRTTGATAEACAVALKKAGAVKIYVLTYALVLAPYRPHIDA